MWLWRSVRMLDDLDENVFENASIEYAVCSCIPIHIYRVINYVSYTKPSIIQVGSLK